MKFFNIKPNSMSEGCKNACEPTSNMKIMGYFYQTKFGLCFAITAVSPLLVYVHVFCFNFCSPLEPTLGGLVGFVYILVDVVFGVVMLGCDMIWDILYVWGCYFVICDMCCDVLCFVASPVPRECGGWASPMHRPTPTSCRRHSAEESAYIC